MHRRGSGEGHARGSRHARAVLTEADVLEIVRRHQAGESKVALTDTYGAQVWSIFAGRTWGWLTGIDRQIPGSWIAREQRRDHGLPG
jgi:hypothetical protein